MKKVKSSLLAGISALFLACSRGGKGDLKEIVKPYLGVYECTDARVGERAYLDRFSKLDLELKENGEFIVYYCEKDGKPQTQTGRYEYDKERETLTLQGGGIKRAFPLQCGVLTVVIPIGGQTIHLKFEQK
jgi:hypothetical protein